MNNKQNLLFVGEAMLELVNKGEDSLGKSFAGDVYNTSVYLKRAFEQFNTKFVSALGQDKLSQEFITSAETQCIDTSLIARSQKHHMGVYMVVNDKHGERSFIYWRNDSAAKRMMSLLSNDLINKAQQTNDMVFFSGITIAILLPKERELFWQFLKKQKSNGALIVFDPNYRPALWENVETAKAEIHTAFTISDWLMPGLDDFKSLYQLSTIEQCIEFCSAYEFEELIIKQGSDAVHIINKDGHEINEIIVSQNVVDTTSAGDAFNGLYLGARLSGNSSAYATKIANYGASKVIETPGAIMPKNAFLDAITQWRNSTPAN
jgi:2-dehydro-3-deoxygluconokinase